MRTAGNLNILLKNSLEDSVTFTSSCGGNLVGRDWLSRDILRILVNPVGVYKGPMAGVSLVFWLKWATSVVLLIVPIFNQILASLGQ